MNEVTKIHLGRQSFSISVEAQRSLRRYLDAIEKQVKDKGVVDEIELRMAELLAEHGVSGDKVILPADINYLKGQLGDPKDFKEDDSDTSAEAALPIDNKRLFRDTDHAMIAGVASGLAAYFGIDVLLIRILFVAGTIAWGGGILLYILLWLLIPEAKSGSDRLQMAGKAVTVESLKEVVERADVKAAARRANKSIASPINALFNVVVKLAGIALTLTGLSLLVGLLASTVFLLVHGNIVLDNLFPIGFKEHMLVYLSAFAAALMAIFVVLFGMAVFKRKWPIRLWLTGVLVGLTVMGVIGSAALAADTVPRVRDRYNAHFRTFVKNVQPYGQVNVIGPASIDSRASDKYYVTVRYYDQSDPSKIKISVKNNILLIDTSQYQWDRQCASVCIPNHYDLEVTVYSPNPSQIFYPLPDEPYSKIVPQPPMPVTD
jgi:phage shock protein PspC (stress-responsive transcriptional regulator)